MMTTWTLPAPTRASLALLVAVLLLCGVATAEASRHLPQTLPTGLEPPPALLPEPPSDTTPDYRLFQPEDLSLLAAFPSNDLSETLALIYDDHFRLHLRLQLEVPSLLIGDPWETASGVQTRATEANIWKTRWLTGNRNGPFIQGLWTDPVTGIAYARNRWYDARNAGWLSEDSVGTFDSQNHYAFVGWAPQLRTDPMGLVGQTPFPSYNNMPGPKPPPESKEEEYAREQRVHGARKRYQIDWSLGGFYKWFYSQFFFTKPAVEISHYVTRIRQSLADNGTVLEGASVAWCENFPLWKSYVESDIGVDLLGKVLDEDERLQREGMFVAEVGETAVFLALTPALGLKRGRATTGRGVASARISETGRGVYGHQVVDRIAAEAQGAFSQANRMLAAGNRSTPWARLYQGVRGSGRWFENVARRNALHQLGERLLLNNRYVLEARRAGYIVQFNKGSALGLRGSRGGLLRPDIQIGIPGGRWGIVDWTTEGSAAKIFNYSDPQAPFLINVTLP